MLFTIKTHIECIIYIFIFVSIMTLQAKNQKGVRFGALSPKLPNETSDIVTKWLLIRW